MFSLNEINNNSRLSERGERLCLKNVAILLIGILAVTVFNAILLELFNEKLSEKFGELFPIISSSVIATFVYVSAFLLIQFFLFSSKLSWNKLLGLEYGKIESLFCKGMFWGFVLFFVVGGLKTCLEYLTEVLGVQMPEQEIVDLLKNSESLKLYQLLLISVVPVVLAPIIEEILFRGILYISLCQAVKPINAALVVSLFFGICHGNLLVLFPLTLFSLMLIYLYEKEGNLLVCIFAHVTFNLLNIVLIQFNA